MQAELDRLEKKITQLVQLNTRLREENHHLRQELAQALDQGQQCSEKIDHVKLRLEQLLEKLPEEPK